MKTALTSPIEQSLSVGQQAIFYPESQRPGKQRLEAVVRGWQRGAYILLEVHLENERSIIFHEGDACSLRFLNKGVAYAIESTLVDWQVSRREPHMRIAWPSSLRSAAVRRHERIEVAVRCRIHYQDMDITGTVRDLSAGGCGILAECTATAGSKITLACCLPDGVHLEGVPLLVRAAKPAGDGQFYLGCSFTHSHHPGYAEIAFYVGTSVLRMRQHNGQAPRFLVVGRDTETLGDLRESLDPTQCNVVTAVSLLEALVHARLVVPACILLEFDWGQANALDACRILRDSPAHFAVPIIVFGRPGEPCLQNADEASVRTQVQEAGGTDYYPDLPDLDTVQLLVRNAGDGNLKA